MICKHAQDEICVNADCQMCADYCPVIDNPGVCKYEDLEEEAYVLTPKGCLQAALHDTGIRVGVDDFDTLWTVFVDLMTKHGYAPEEQEIDYDFYRRT